MHRIRRIFLRNFKNILQHEKSDTKHIFTSPLCWPIDVTPTSNNYSSEAPLIRNQMAHTPVDTHYTAPVNTPTNSSDAISGPKNTFHIHHHFTCSSVCVICSITCTKCSMLYIGETCHQLSTRFGEHLRSVEEEKHLSPDYQDDDDLNIAIHFNLPNHSIDDMGISALLYAPTEKLPRKTLKKKSSLSLEQSSHLNSSLSYFK